MARTRWPPGPVNPGLWHRPGRSDRQRRWVPKNGDPADSSISRQPEAASADSEVRPGPGPDPTPASPQNPGSRAGSAIHILPAEFALVADSAFAAVNQRRISVLFFGRADLAACKSLYARRCRAFGSQACQAVLRAEPAESRARRGRNISHTRRTASTGTASARAASTWRRNLLQNVPLGPCSTHLHRDGPCTALRLFPVAVTHSRLRGLFSNGAVSTASGARPPLPRLRRDIMHPMFKELFIQTDADDLAAEEDRQRRVCRSRRARPAMIIRPAPNRENRSRS